MTKNIDLPKRTYKSAIEFNEHGQNYLEIVGGFYADLRNQDYALLLQSEKEGREAPTRQQRRDALYASKLTKREADNIIVSNDQQWDLAERDSVRNIANWMNDIAKIDDQLAQGTLSRKRCNNLVSEKRLLESKIDKREKKGHSVAFGSRRLQRLITKYPHNLEYREEREKKRLFLDFVGDKSRTGQNPVLRVNPDTWEVKLRVPVMVQELYTPFHNTQWVTIGVLNPKSGRTLLYKTLQDKQNPISYQFVWCKNKKKWRVHFTLTASAEDFGKRGNLSRRSKRFLGLDVNAGHVDMSVVDNCANVLANQTIEYNENTDMNDVAERIVKFADRWGVSVLGVENLSSLSRSRKSTKLSKKGLNKAITAMRYSLLLKALEGKSFTYGLSIVKVSPAYTSKNTVQWPELFFGATRHIKASYLIARRAMGLPIARRRVSGAGHANSVWCGDDFDTPFDRQPHYSTISIKRTSNTTAGSIRSLA